MSETREPTTAQPGRQRLDGKLGVFSIVFMVIAAAAPITVIGGNVPIAIASGNGIGAPVGFLIATIVLLIFAVGFVSMTPYVREAGAFFSYVTAGLGPRPGLGTAFVALTAYTAIQVGIYGYFGWAVNDIVQYYGGPSIPWGIYALVALAVVAFLGYRRIELSSKVLGVALVLEITAVLIVDAAIFATGGANGVSLASFSPENALAPGLGVAVLFALTGFIGFEATAVFRDEARQPERTIPRATYIAVLVIGGLYTVSCWALITGTGLGDARSIAQRTLDGEGNMLPDIAGQYAGSVIQNLIQVLMVTSLFACVLAFHNVIARYQFILAQRSVLPRALARVHPTHSAPSVSSVTQSCTALILVVVLAALGIDPLVGVFGSMAGVATVGMVILMLITSVSVFAFFARRADLRNARFGRTVVAPIAAIVGLLVSLALVLTNFGLVTGADPALSTTLALIPVVALLVGLALGGRMTTGRGDDSGS